MVKIRDPEPAVEFESVEAEPSWLKVRIKPHGSEGASRGLYQLEIEIPRDAPSCYYLAPRYGQIKIKPKHPRVEAIDLKVHFAVMASVVSR
jgi:hypothetical protein